MTSRVLKGLLLAAIIAAPWVTQAQNARDYRMETCVDTTLFAPLTSSATHVSSIEGEDDEGSELFNIGFTFSFAGTSYTQFSRSSNGRVRLGTSCSTSGTTSSFSAWPGVGRYYTLTPQPPSSCPSVNAISMIAVTANSANIEWAYNTDDAGTPIGYEIEYGPVDGTVTTADGRELTFRLVKQYGQR